MGQRLHVKYDAAKLNANCDCRRDCRCRDEGVARTRGTDRVGAVGQPERTWLLAGAGSFFAAGLLASALNAPAIFPAALYACSVAAGVQLTARKAWQASRLRSLDINVLMLSPRLARSCSANG